MKFEEGKVENCSEVLERPRWIISYDHVWPTLHHKNACYEPAALYIDIATIMVWYVSKAYKASCGCVLTTKG